MSPISRVRSCLLVLLSALGLLAAGLTTTASAAGPAASAPNGIYLVQMSGEPVVAYRGGVAGLRATAPARGQKVDPQSADVVRYVSHLRSKHDAALARVGGRKVHDYAFSYDGFAARLDARAVAELRRQPGVVAVTADEIRRPDTSTTPAFLGLTAAGGLWSQLDGAGGAGEGMVVGVIDSGITPESLSFSDRTGSNGSASKDGKLGYRQLPGWHGRCIPGDRFTAMDCNLKLIGARHYGEGYGGRDGVKALFPYEFWSARDADGHGTHTASTAAGNGGVRAVVDGADLGTISGMAPRARVAAYKVCWGTGDEGGCPNSDSVAAIDQAVADGVDVLNFSISGSTTSSLTPVEVAFLFAADAGVFVAASAGNNGPGASTVAHNSPWLTTVAAGTHDRSYSATVTLGNGASYTGAGLGAAVGSAPLVRSDDVGTAGKPAEEVRLCYPGSLDPAKVTGTIVVCDRGVLARPDKSLAVRQAGGIGMVLLNTSPSSVNADLHHVPTVHLPDTARTAVRAYAATATATASLSQGTGGPGAEAPDVASFSSRGPALAGAGDLLKPDLMAPGVDVLAAVSPAPGGRSFDFYSGTSMSSPHVAGIGALLSQRHPTWSPAAVRSALMTSASQVRNTGTAIAGGPFDFGSGQVVPTSPADPGLVYDSGFADWLAWLCGTGQLTGALCAGPAKDPSDLNYPSIAIGALAGRQTVTRTVTNVSGAVETYSATASLPGIDVQVAPSSFTVQPGGTATYAVTFTRTTAAVNAYSSGALVLTGSNGHRVRSPLVVRPVALAAPAEVTGSYPVTFGYDGAFSATARGLVPAAVTPGTVGQDPDQTFVKGDAAGTVEIPVTVPAGTTHARFALFDADVAAGADIDLYVHRGGTLVGSSGSGTSAEQVDLRDPTAGEYTVSVHGWGLPAGTSGYALHTWLVGGAAAGNLTVGAPAQASVGQTATITLTPTGLQAGTKYLGAVAYGGAVAGLPAPTLVRMDG
jgi:subtilisin family serine protease